MITLGRDENVNGWPWYRASHNAKQTLLRQSPYRFHDAASYLKLVKNEASDLKPETVEYLEEAIATYYADCLPACCVMVGVAAEIEFIRMLDQGAQNASVGPIFQGIQRPYQLKKKIDSFKDEVENQRIPASILRSAGEELDTHLLGIQSVLRVARNAAGHALPSKPLLREQVYVYLQMFVPFLGYVSRLRQAL